ncbi:hypothetical protein [Hydrogenophaga taeniospiralis]|nr:hypothetical protein [Hydrogenophaga taeniospiralis]
MSEPNPQETRTAGSAIAADSQDAGQLNHNARSMRLPKWTWQGFLTVTSVLMGASAVLLHLIGSAIHQTYLSQWGIDAGQFPKSTDWLVIQGYYGIWSALGIAFTALLKNAPWVILSGITVALYLAIVFGSWSPFGTRVDTPNRVSKWPGWARRFFLISVVGGVIAAALLPITLVLFLLAGIPAVIGKGIGEEVAVKQAQDFATGCAASKGACIRLLKEGKLIGEGYLIDSSSSHIAFLDVSLKKARVIARDGLELQATRLPTPQ